MDRLEQLKEAQGRVDNLRASGAAMTSPEARRAVNRLITLIRGATQEELAAFDRWKQEHQHTGTVPPGVPRLTS